MHPKFYCNLACKCRSGRQAPSGVRCVQCGQWTLDTGQRRFRRCKRNGPNGGRCSRRCIGASAAMHRPAARQPPARPSTWSLRKRSGGGRNGKSLIDLNFDKNRLQYAVRRSYFITCSSKYVFVHPRRLGSTEYCFLQVSCNKGYSGSRKQPSRHASALILILALHNVSFSLAEHSPWPVAGSQDPEPYPWIRPVWFDTSPRD